MKILFITLVAIDNIEDRGIYQDLMRCFISKGHHVTIVSPLERRYKKHTQIIKNEQYTILRPKILNIQKTNIFEKTISTLLIDIQLLISIKKNIYINDTDIIIYSTPPITLTRTISYCKSHSNAFSYLLLKDIFPQNALDLGMMTKASPLYRYFRRKEERLYNLSDKIGCMSPANVAYVQQNNTEVTSQKIEECPNSIYPILVVPDEDARLAARQRLNLPVDKVLFVYGGNLGRPQAVDYIIDFLAGRSADEKGYYMIVGSGTEYGKLENWCKQTSPRHVTLSPFLPKAAYDDLLEAADAGLIFLDHRFSIPNFPSRLLSYMEYGLPILAATDDATDIGKIITEGCFGFSASSSNLSDFNTKIDAFLQLQPIQRKEMGLRGRLYLESHYHVNTSYEIIINAYKEAKHENII